MYSVRWLSGEQFDSPCTKVVCVGRNYAEHAKELNNPVPSRPILFIKPESSIQDSDVLFIPRDGIHYETELAILIGQPVTPKQPASEPESKVLDSVAGIGLALDLTDRDLQSQLKEKGHPWERAKSFDGACFLTAFIPYDGHVLSELGFGLDINDNRVQSGHTRDMLFAIPKLLSEISQTFSLRPGDVVLTGTPKGVGTLEQGDKLQLTLNLESKSVQFPILEVAHRGQ